MPYTLEITTIFDSGDGPEIRKEQFRADTPRDLIVEILNAIYDGVPLESIVLEVDE